MKNILLFALVILAAITTQAQDKSKTTSKDVTTRPAPAATAPATTSGQDKKDAAPNPNAPKMIFTEETYEFGELIEGPQATHEFKFTNTGKEPLVLSNVHASCGCTTPSWPKEPILPGTDAKILVTYNTQGRVGPFTKSITINSNSDQPNKVIYIKGEVVRADPEKSVPVEQPTILSPKN